MPVLGPVRNQVTVSVTQGWPGDGRTSITRLRRAGADVEAEIAASPQGVLEDFEAMLDRESKRRRLRNP
jgi:hypothetical protein